MAATSLSYTYRYPFESAVETAGPSPTARIAPGLDGTSDDLFFRGSPKKPATLARALLCVSEIVRTRFFQPRPAAYLLDPIVTSGGGWLRFEGFSSCNGVYARADVNASAFDCDLRGKGTTNVDFNEPMRRALRQLRDHDHAVVAVGGDGVELETARGSVIERKVKLPVRWVKGLCEIQAYQPRLVSTFDLTGAEARPLIQKLPRGREGVVTKTGRTWRWATRGGARIGGPERLKPLEPLMRDAERVRIWTDDESGTSAWQVEAEYGRLFLLLSPETNRGFSGEGQMLGKLATGDWESALAPTSDAMNWSSAIDPSAIAQKNGLSEAAVEAALAVLGTRGLAGYDAELGRYYHRVMPFDMDRVEKTQPRLKAARELVDHVKLLKEDGFEIDAVVPGSSGTDHVVRLRPDGDRCTCPWGLKHSGVRGPCKHVLATRMKVEGESSPIVKQLEEAE